MLYHDRYIDCDAEGVRVRWYYFPFGTKHVRYADIVQVTRVPLSRFRGQLRIWGTSTFRYWASLDPSRPKKTIGFILETRSRIRPFLTPDDPDGFARALQERSVLLRDGETAPLL